MYVCLLYLPLSVYLSICMAVYMHILSVRSVCMPKTLIVRVCLVTLYSKMILGPIWNGKQNFVCLLNGTSRKKLLQTLSGNLKNKMVPKVHAIFSRLPGTSYRKNKNSWHSIGKGIYRNIFVSDIRHLEQKSPRFRSTERWANLYYIAALVKKMQFYTSLVI